MFIYIGSKHQRFYNGLKIKADLGLHEEITNIVKSKVPSGSKILDLGAGEGALSERLVDIGYEVVAVDMNKDDFKSHKAKFIELDFNDKLLVDKFISKNIDTFHAVLGIEVIEHIEDQWSYVRQLVAMVKPGGLIVITTPNITSWLSRLIFLFTGRFHQFADSDLAYGHINPICNWRLRLILQQCGIAEVDVKSAGTLSPIYFGGNSFFTRIVIGVMSILDLPFYLIMRGIKSGWCVMAIGRKKAAQ